MKVPNQSVAAAFTETIALTYVFNRLILLWLAIDCRVPTMGKHDSRRGGRSHLVGWVDRRQMDATARNAGSVPSEAPGRQGTRFPPSGRFAAGTRHCAASAV